jgi:hypothetical protein
MTWTFDYETYGHEYNTSSEKMQAVMKRALDYAKKNLTDGWQKQEDDFIVIRVEGYHAIALVTDEFLPIEICTRIFPYDENQIYPMQEVEAVPQFKRY